MKEFYGSKIGLGTANFGMDYGISNKLEFDAIKPILDFAICNDIRFIDTAYNYGDSEEKIGKYLIDNPNELTVSTKCKYISLKDNPNLIIQESIKTSLDRLNLDSIEIFLMHQEDEFLIYNPIFWDTISQLKKSGKIKKFGFSVYDFESTKKLLIEFGDEIDVLQVPINIFDQRFLKLKEIYRSKNIYVIARSIFMRGYITSKHVSLPTEFKEVLEKKRLLNNVAKIHKISVTQIALDFILREQIIDKFIVGVNCIKDLNELVNIKKSSNLLEIDFQQFQVFDYNELDLRKW